MDSEAFAATTFVSMILSIVILGHFIRKYRFKYATEGSIALLIGLVVGGLYYVYYAVDSKRRVPFSLITFNNNVFFHVLLPPIIFYAGFSVKKKLFFRNFSTIAVFGILGTFFYTGLISLGTYGIFKSMFSMTSTQALQLSLAVGAIFSCSDTVSTLQVLDQDSTPVLYSLVFGEGVVNDATAIVLLGAVQNLSHHQSTHLGNQLSTVLLTFVYLFLASLALGVAIGLASALLIRHLFRPHATDREVLAVGLMGFLAYSLAETLDLSAILSVFFCGITMSHYTYYNLSDSAQSITHHSFRIIAAAMEITLFTFGGLDMWLTALWRNQTAYSSRQLGVQIATLSLTLLFWILTARALFISTACAAANRLWRRSHKISLGEGVTIWWAGLARGAITLALVYHQFYHTATTDVKQQVVIAASIVVVLVTTVGFGSVTSPFLEWVMRRTAPPAPPPGVNRHNSAHSSSLYLGEGAEVPLLNGANGTVPPLLQLLPAAGERRFLHKLWHNFDHAVMQPLFGGSSLARRQLWGGGSKRSVGGSFVPALVPEDGSDEGMDPDLGGGSLGGGAAALLLDEVAVFQESWDDELASSSAARTPSARSGV